MKKIPNIYANKINKKIANNEKVYYSDKEKESEPLKKDDRTINEKINEIFNSSNYIYRISVSISTKNKNYDTKVIGKNSKSLITIDNEVIPIEEIIDIKIVD